MKIEEYLNVVYKYFREYVINSSSICEMDSLRYDHNNLPNYANKHIQEYYILRYTYSYAFNYKYLYQSVLKDMTGKKLSVLSLGCGNLVDYWGLRQGISRKAQINYTGIDAIDWNYKFCAENDDRVIFKNEDIVKFILSEDKLPYDVFLFPMSISELDMNQIYSIGNKLGESIVTGKMVKILISLRDNKYNLRKDLEKVEALKKSICNNKVRCLKDKKYSLQKNIEEEHIEKLDQAFHYPENIKAFLGNLTHCNNSKLNEKCRECELKNNRYPKLKCQGFIAKILVVEKE